MGTEEQLKEHEELLGFIKGICEDYLDKPELGFTAISHLVMGSRVGRAKRMESMKRRLEYD